MKCNYEKRIKMNGMSLVSVFFEKGPYVNFSFLMMDDFFGGLL